MAKAKKPAPSVGGKTGQLEVAVHETNHRLDRIERTLETSSKLFGLMHDRLVNLEDGQKLVVARLVSLEEGQREVIGRLDRLIDATTRDRTEWLERFTTIDELRRRLERLEEHVHFPPQGPAGH
jgi:hypothetical protein